MNYRGHDTFAFFNASFVPTENLRLFAEFSFNQTDEGIDGLAMDPSTLVGVPPGGLFDYHLPDYLGALSHLDIRQIMGKYGFEYSLPSGWFLNGSLRHNDYDDGAPYLFDSTGSYVSVVAGLGYKF